MQRMRNVKIGARTAVICLIFLVLALASCAQEGPSRSAAPANPPRQGGGDAAQPQKKAASQLVRLSVPQGTEIHLTLAEGVSSATSQAGDTFTARTTDPVVVGNRVAIPAGSTIRGQVTDVIPAKKGLKEKGGVITLSFDKVETPAGFSAPMSATVASVGKSGKKTAGIIGGSAAGGAVLGKILGGSTKDAALGAVVGGAIGTGIAAGTRGKEVEIPAGSHLAVALDQSLTIAVKP
ncbi:MAG: hypothetical protein L0Z52_12965 [Acidobacteria bacterium]|nr:hypothetical protein [Acidobacteriota bacterium]